MQSNELKKVSFSNEEVLEYLENMLQSGLATEEEENVYYDVKYTGKCNKKELSKVKRNLHNWYHEKF